MKYMSAVFRIFISVTMISSTSLSVAQADENGPVASAARDAAAVQAHQVQTQQAQAASEEADCGDSAGPAPTPNALGNSTNTGADERLGRGNRAGCMEIRSIHGQLTDRVVEANTDKIAGNKRREIVAAYEKYRDNRPNCISRHSTAASACLEGLSPNLATAAATVNTLLSTAGTAVTDNCSKFKSAMDIAKAGLTMYTAACGVAKTGCGMSCVSARSGLERMKSLGTAELARMAAATCDTGVSATDCQAYKDYYAGILNRIPNAVQTELDRNGSNGSIAEKASACTAQYAALAASAVSGIASLMGAFNQGNKCEDETTANPTPTASVADLTNKCQKEENKNLPECICMANPRTEGCSGSGGERAGNNNSRSGLTTGDGSNGATRTVAGADLGSDTPMGIEPGAVNNSGGGAGASGSTGGGGSGLGGGSGGGSGGPNAAADGAGGKGLDTNILGGASGGGSGGGYGGVGGSGDKYRQYLPGGAKDPAKGMAGQSAASREVTGQGGKSNFEKVKDRYIDNKKSLLNN